MRSWAIVVRTSCCHARESAFQLAAVFWACRETATAPAHTRPTTAVYAFRAMLVIAASSSVVVFMPGGRRRRGRRGRGGRRRLLRRRRGGRGRRVGGDHLRRRCDHAGRRRL